MNSKDLFRGHYFELKNQKTGETIDTGCYFLLQNFMSQIEDKIEFDKLEDYVIYKDCEPYAKLKPDVKVIAII